MRGSPQAAWMPGRWMVRSHLYLDSQLTVTLSEQACDQAEFPQLFGRSSQGCAPGSFAVALQPRNDHLHPANCNRHSRSFDHCRPLTLLVPFATQGTGRLNACFPVGGACGVYVLYHRYQHLLIGHQLLCSRSPLLEHYQQSGAAAGCYRPVFLCYCDCWLIVRRVRRVRRVRCDRGVRRDRAHLIVPCDSVACVCWLS